MSPDTSTHRLHEQVKSVYQLLSEPQLHIPNYQRPYKWTADNLQALLTDLRNYRDKSAYRLASLCRISHSKNAKLSNHSTTAIKEHFQAASTQSKINSLKLYKMLGLLIKDSGR